MDSSVSRERRNLVSAHVSSHFRGSVLATFVCTECTLPARVSWATQPSLLQNGRVSPSLRDTCQRLSAHDQRVTGLQITSICITFVMYHCSVRWHYRYIHEFVALAVPSHSFLSSYLVFQCSTPSVLSLFLLTLSQAPIPVTARSKA